jgi:hypothetical protein
LKAEEEAKKIEQPAKEELKEPPKMARGSPQGWPTVACGPPPYNHFFKSFLFL